MNASRLSAPGLLAVLGLVAALGLSASIQAAEFRNVQTDQSTLGFGYKQMGVGMDGRFKKFTTQLSFDPAKVAAARVSIDVDIASIDAGSAEANSEVTSKLWFNAKGFPTTRFVSTSIKPLGGNRYEVAGPLTIKGRTRNVSAPFTFTPQASNAVFDGAFVIRRADFAIGEGLWADFGTVANEIQIKFHVLASSGK